MSYTVKELEKIISEFNDEAYGTLTCNDDFYDAIEWGYEFTTSLGSVKKVAEESDYDEGNQSKTLVFCIDDSDGKRYFRITGYYSSWGETGGWDGSLEEVRPREVIAIEWDTV